MQKISVFRPIKGFPGYAISQGGEVISFRGKYPRTLSLTLTAGYYHVSLQRDGKSHTRQVHCLVAQSFIGERPLGYVIDHIDGNPCNNCVENLHYVTQRENIHNPNTIHRNAKQYQCRKISATKNGVTQVFNSMYELCQCLGLHSGTVSKCLSPHYPTCCSSQGYHFAYC